MLTQARIDSRPSESKFRRRRELRRLLGRMLAHHVFVTRTREAEPIDGRVAVNNEIKRQLG